MSDLQNYDEYIKIGIAAGQIIFAAIGWNIISRGNDKREQRKELRALLNEIRMLTTQIETKVIEYYSLEPFKSREVAVQVKRLLKQVATLATTVARYDHRYDVSQHVAELRMKATGGDFESAARQPTKDDDNLFNEIAAAGMQLIDELESTFARRYS